MRERMGIDLAPEQIVEEMLDSVIEQVEHAVPWREGAVELLSSLGEAGVPCALVTMSWTRFVKPILEGLPVDTFAAVVTGDTVDRGKPHPEPYLTAARELDVLAGDCLAIEDSDTGATSAVAAGCTVLCAPLHVQVPPGPGRVFTDSLVGLSASSLLPASSCGLVPNRRFGPFQRAVWDQTAAIPSPPAIVVVSRPPRDTAVMDRIRGTGYVLGTNAPGRSGAWRGTPDHTRG